MGDQVAHVHADQINHGGPVSTGDMVEREGIVLVADVAEKRDSRFRGIEIADIDGGRHPNDERSQFPARAANNDAADVGIKSERIGMVPAIENLDLELTGPARDLEVAVLADADHTTDVLGEVLDHC